MKQQVFRTVCAWCRRVLGERIEPAADDAPGLVVSHGICTKCRYETRVAVDDDHSVVTVHDSDGPETVMTLWGPMVVGGEG